jgi:2-polyprenyl-3-methyl-5-hydroxy-6-metoxy-1,4-benzoquinol methylase
MINYILYKLNRVENGFDPVSKEYADAYYKRKDTAIINQELDNLESIVGSVENKSVLDLGAGPGYYATAFAKRNAITTWADISNNYMQIAKQDAILEKVNVQYQLCYLDDFKGKFDVIFNRICFYYCINDKKFAEKIYDALLPNGIAYILFHNENRLYHTNDNIIKKIIAVTKYKLNNATGIKIGHPPISKSRMQSIFERLQPTSIEISEYGLDTLIIVKK